ncbi:MAG: spore cortex-lytic enzyme [Peptococcaceae bacterium]|nr:spore cortex-lytic enzyme [Candidatus Syntrophopropionicum ammoniitolerans]
MILLHGLASAQGEVLSWGSKGAEVSGVQQRLSQWGYYNGSMDGVYGSATFSAVQKFQRSNGLPQNGIVDQKTREALGLGSSSDATTLVSRGVATGGGDTTLLARVIEGEAADEPLQGKVAVGAVIMNRTKSAAFPGTVGGVIFQDYAFESISNGQANRAVSQQSVQAAQMAMSGYDPTSGALFFWNPYKPVSPWVWSRNIITQIGNHVFAL